jgi:hypothetical protein
VNLSGKDFNFEKGGSIPEIAFLLKIFLFFFQNIGTFKKPFLCYGGDSMVK